MSNQKGFSKIATIIIIVLILIGGAYFIFSKKDKNISSNQVKNYKDYTPRVLFSSQKQIEKLEKSTVKIGEKGGVIRLTDGTKMSISDNQLPSEIEFTFYSLNEILKKSFEANRSYLPIVGAVKIFVDADKTRFFVANDNEFDTEANNERDIEVMTTLVARQAPGTKLEVVKPNMSSTDWAETGLFAVVDENGMTATFTVKRPNVYGLLSKEESQKAENKNNQTNQPTGESTLIDNLSIYKSNQKNQSGAIIFKEHGTMVKKNSVWIFTVLKYESESGNWNKEAGPFTLRFTDNSMCQSRKIKSTKCTDFPSLKDVTGRSYDFYKSIEIEGAKNDDEIIVSKLTIMK